ncbi:MAG: type II toxin-antitoxin system PemK/MazF family toxin [Acidobacteriota bacterium]
MKQGEVVLGAFPGAEAIKTRPAVVLSTEDYHRHRPDVVVGIITSQQPRLLGPTDYPLTDWQQAGLRLPSFFRLYLVTLPRNEVRRIGILSERDWNGVRRCLRAGLGELT